MMNINQQAMNDTLLAVAISKPSVTPVLKPTNENVVPAVTKPANEINSKPFDLSPKPKPVSTSTNSKLMLRKNQNPAPKPPSSKEVQGKNEKPKAVMKKS